MPKVERDINIRSEEIQDLMVKEPAWMIRWGTTNIFLIIILLLVFTWIMKYPDIIYGRVVLTVDKPPVKLVNRVNGKISHLFVADDEKVKVGQMIAEIENPISVEVIKYLEVYIDELDSVIASTALNLPLPDTGDRSYGDLQNRINEMRNDLTLYNLKRTYDLELLSIQKLQERIVYHKDLIRISEDLLKIEKEELDNAKVRYEADKALYEDSVLSKFTFMQSQTQYHKNQQQYDELQLKIVQYRLTLSAMEIELESNKFNRDQNLRTDLERILAHREFILNFINSWKQMYALISPVDGYLTYLMPIHEGEYIKEDDSYFAVVQDNYDMIGWADVPATGYGKIDEGQRVNVRLDNYPYHEFGLLEGEVIKVGKLPDNDLYRVGISFPNGLMTTYKNQLEFSPEMTGSAEIVTRDKRLIERIFDSIIKLINRGHHTSNVT